MADKPKPTDEQLKQELENLKAKRTRYAAGVVEMDARMKELRKLLNIKDE